MAIKGINNPNGPDCEAVAEKMNKMKQQYAAVKAAKDQQYADETADVCRIVAEGNERKKKENFYITVTASCDHDSIHEVVDCVNDQLDNRIISPKLGYYFGGFISGVMAAFAVAAVYVIIVMGAVL